MKQRLLAFVFCFAVLLLIVLQIASLLPFVAENKENLSFDMIGDHSLTILLSPIPTITALIKANNPVFYFLTGLSFIYALFIAYKIGKDNTGWKVDPKEQSHGSARPAKPKEIFTGQDYVGATKKQVLDEFRQSLEVGNEKGEVNHGG